MIRDHRPYWVKRLYLNFQNLYVRRFIRPQLRSLGCDFTFMKPWHVEVFGAPVEIGRCVNIIAASDRKVRLSVWGPDTGGGRIRIGDYVLICPGVRIGSSASVEIGDNCMIASGVYITDADWHGVYDRVSAGKAASVCIRDNVWIGDGAIVCKGVTIGENSIVGTGSVVVNSIPRDTIAAGNPARPVKQLDPSQKIVKRELWFSNPRRLARDIDALDRAMLGGNTFFHWLRCLAAPHNGD